MEGAILLRLLSLERKLNFLGTDTSLVAASAPWRQRGGDGERGKREGERGGGRERGEGEREMGGRQRERGGGRERGRVAERVWGRGRKRILVKRVTFLLVRCKSKLL